MMKRFDILGLETCLDIYWMYVIQKTWSFIIFILFVDSGRKCQLLKSVKDIREKRYNWCFFENTILRYPTEKSHLWCNHKMPRGKALIPSGTDGCCVVWHLGLSIDNCDDRSTIDRGLEGRPQHSRHSHGPPSCTGRTASVHTWQSPSARPRHPDYTSRWTSPIGNIPLYLREHQDQVCRCLALDVWWSNSLIMPLGRIKFGRKLNTGWYWLLYYSLKKSTASPNTCVLVVYHIGRFITSGTKSSTE